MPPDVRYWFPAFVVKDASQYFSKRRLCSEAVTFVTLVVG
jgi:hypothetical protein